MVDGKLNVGCRRRALTLPELLVVMGVVAVLAACLAPAIRRIQANARRTCCVNKMRQIGLALRQFHDTNLLFPSNGGWDGKQTILSVVGPAFTPSTYDRRTNYLSRWGVGDPRLSPEEQMGSWAFSILPFLGRELTYRQRQWTKAVPEFTCPARRACDALVMVSSQDDFGRYQGGGWTWGRTDYAASAAAFANRPRCRSADTITDGLASTILIGEKAFNPMLDQAATWYWDEPFFLGGSGGTARAGATLMHDNESSQRPYEDNWGSPHERVVHFLFGDGTVHSLAFTIDRVIFSALLTPDSGDQIMVH
jgi:prepilin-type N-terminal cleavage/methylation domain-containing protein